MDEGADGHLAVRVSGSPRLGVQLVGSALREAGVRVVGAETQDPAPDVTVLVEPSAEDWARAIGNETPIVVVPDSEPDDKRVVEAVLKGADGVVTADGPVSELVEAVHAVAAGGTALAPTLVRAVVERARAAESRDPVRLTLREGQILRSIATGRSVKQTARDLGISMKTVENLQGRLFRKLGVRNRAQAVARGHSLGLLGDPADAAAGIAT